MTKQVFCGTVCLLAAIITGASHAPAAEAIHAQPSKPLPRVLLIGDSICGGYYKVVQRELEGKAMVVKNEGNAEYTGTGLKKLDEWLGDGKWDVIHFNWGLWDMYGWQYAKVDRSPTVYQERLNTLVSRLEKTGARLIWATTTPACPGPEKTIRNRFKTELRITPAVEHQYLDAAMRVMKQHDIQINDLHALIKHRWETNPPPPDHDNVHFDGSTNNALGKQVAAAIVQALGSSAESGPQAGTKKSVKEFLVSGTATAVSFNWQTTDTSLALRNGNKIVWRLVIDPKQQKTYFHPLATVNGEVLTALHPADHPWHCGLWWSWKYINGLNYWDWDWAKGNNGKTEGVNELTGKAVTTNRDFSAQVVLNFSYHPTDMPPVLTETRTLSIASPDKNGNYRIDWTSVFIAGAKPVKLDRTPPSKTMGGYAGLSLRFPKGLKGWRFLTSENAATAAQGNGKKAQWADFSGPAAGIAVFDHPENLRHPSLWYLNEDLPFLSPAVLYKGPLELAPKQELKLRYYVLVHSGAAQKALLDKEWKAFAQ
jgi:hypothetical protein